MAFKDKAAYNAYMNEYMKQRYARRRQDAIESLGGCCVDCGSIDELELHHLDPAKKSFTMAKGSSFSEVRWQEELAKCVLKCEACHIDEHRTEFTCGTAQKYWSGCKCQDCKSANTRHSREYKANR